MLRRLIVMRHAKSSWKSEAVEDHDRPLNKRGRRDSPVIAGHLQEIGWAPEVVLSSDSARTTETLHCMIDAFQPRPRVDFLRGLYHGGIHELREAAARVSSEVGTVLALGHNPGWEDAVHWLTAQHVELKTANAALLESSGQSWRDVLQGEGSWQLLEVIRPKQLLSS